MARIETAARRFVYAAGIALAVVVAPALAVLAASHAVETTVAQEDCASGEARGQNIQCAPDVPGVTAPVGDAPSVSEVQENTHSGSHH